MRPTTITALVLLISWLVLPRAGAQPAGEPLPPPQQAQEIWHFDQLVEMMRENHPDLAIAHARLEAARGRLIQAGLYPNPTFTWEAEDVGTREGSAGNQGPYESSSCHLNRGKCIIIP